jgi:hypothetical protein
LSTRFGGRCVVDLALGCLCVVDDRLLGRGLAQSGSRRRAFVDDFRARRRNRFRDEVVLAQRCDLGRLLDRWPCEDRRFRNHDRCGLGNRCRDARRVSSLLNAIEQRTQPRKLGFAAHR